LITLQNIGFFLNKCLPLGDSTFNFCAFIKRTNRGIVVPNKQPALNLADQRNIVRVLANSYNNVEFSAQSLAWQLPHTSVIGPFL